MAAASRPIPAINEDPSGATVSFFQGCVEVVASARKGNFKSAREYVRLVQLAATSVPSREPLPELWPLETIDAVMTDGTDEEFDALLASQQALFERLVAEYSDSELATVFSRLKRAKNRGSG